jgi:NAD(P)-dependent dehydrogenase (short-subunit alcohol dehydrogenase family)
VSGTFSEGASGWLPYYTSKRAQEDFLAGLSQDYPQGPRVYGISPAETATPQYEKFYPDEVQEAQPAAVVADATIKIILGEATYETGSIIQVRDGVASKGFHA